MEPRPNGQLLVLSNRIPKGDVPAGGLVYALHEALTGAGGTWIGTADPSHSAEPVLSPIGSGDYDRMTFPVTGTEYDGFYLGYANGVLWPLFHHRADLLDIQDGHFDAYAAVNRRAARVIADRIGPEDTIWIHDYHFLMVASELRKLGVENRIGLFLHIPFPNVTDIMALPEASMLAGWLAAHDLVGLQTERDVAAANDIVAQDGQAQHLNDGTWVRDGRVFNVEAFPIGIDAKGFAETAARVPAPDLLLRPGAPLLIGVDRLDYSKGLVHRFEAFGEFLERRADQTIRPTFLQIAPGSREDVSAYQDIREELERAAGSINGEHASLDWTPIRYIRHHIDRDTIAALYRKADVALVTPLADGMNLVAKEFVAAQDPEDPGVLILSHFAGASEQMDSALMVNPFDAGSFAQAIEQALTMPLAERQARHASLRDSVFEQDVAWWTDRYLKRLRGGSMVPV